MMKIAIIGKPNVGKSTLFNRLCAKNLAIVSEISGTTRDYKEYKAKLYDFNFIAIDTAGLSTYKAIKTPNDSSLLSEKITDYTKKAISISDITLFLLDGKCGISADDIIIAKMLRRSGKKYILVINKSECEGDLQSSDIYSLGLGDSVFISALHNSGMDALYNAIRTIASDFVDYDIENVQNKKEKSELSIAIVGKPNAGKSTLFNALLGENRSIVSVIAGTTRDCIEQHFTINQSIATIVDTAGVRRSSKVQDDIESVALGQSITSIRRSSVILLLIDATSALTNQDLSIARIAINEGKVLILVINKIDLVSDKKLLKQTIKFSVGYNFSDVCDIPIVYISSMEKYGIDLLIDTILQKFAAWQKFCTTSKLNEWLHSAVEKHSPPKISNNKRLKLKYITQKAIRPPTFNIFTNLASKIPHSYEKYLSKSLGQYFDIKGVPIRFNTSHSPNPYVNRKK